MKKLLLLLIIPFLSFGQIVTEDCSSIPNPGMCFAAIPIYYFNQNTGQCEESIWGGCDGLVPFWNLEECQNSCENTEVQGCTDNTACNYNPLSTEDDGSCAFPGDECALDGIWAPLVGVLDDNCECVENASFINEWNSHKILIKVVDVLGRETNNKGFQLEIYDDGSVEKKYLIK